MGGREEEGRAPSYRVRSSDFGGFETQRNEMKRAGLQQGQMSLSTASRLLGSSRRVLSPRRVRRGPADCRSSQASPPSPSRDVLRILISRPFPRLCSIGRTSDVGASSSSARFDSQRSGSQCSQGSREDDMQSVSSKAAHSSARLSYHQRPPLFAKDHPLSVQDPNKLQAIHLQCSEQSEVIGRMEARISSLADTVKRLSDQNSQRKHGFP